MLLLTFRVLFLVVLPIANLIWIYRWKRAGHLDGLDVICLVTVTLFAWGALTYAAFLPFPYRS